MWLHHNFAFMKGRKSDSRSLRKYAEYENNRQWQDQFMRGFNMLVNLFEWKDLPDTVDPYFLESLLLWDAQACIVYDPEFDSYLGLPSVEAGNMNLYYQNNFYRAYSLNYSKRFLALTQYNKDIMPMLLKISGNERKSEIMTGCVCFDNPERYSYTNTLEIYTDKIVNAMRAIDVVQNQAKLPTIIETDEDTKVAIQQAVQDIDMNVLAVYVGRDLAKQIKETKSFPTQFNPAVLDILWAHKNNLEAEKLTAFGLNNLNTNDKKERLLTDEIKSNDQIIELNMASRLDMRKQFCENLNAVFGLNVDVDIRHKQEQPENIGIAERGEISGSDNNDTRRSA